ncbi:hypothetical protein [Pseudovibrio sp. WM33]|uniref:hypothetical protein n=1 Tax=Pseudovibrio sp. WM33 TaxID=1735585 RepID=UPI0007B2CC87|nr:hypothetical protein [Pseudovibrio sp. WM33]KZL26751.1 hypothetical protein PsWM33_01210 [Pseudovibrio sp. WM33]
MKIALCTVLSLFMLIHATIPAHALSSRVGRGDKITTFSDISTTDSTIDRSICQNRYGKVFLTKDHPATIEGEQLVTTSEGQKIELIYQGGHIGNGIYSIENEYKFTSPNNENGKSVDLQLAATGFIGGGRASGVFSDGTCTGNVTIELIAPDNSKKTSPKHNADPITKQ